GAGWLIRGFSNLRLTDPGFVADGRLLFDVGLQGSSFRDQAAVITASKDLHDRIRGLNGVAGVGATNSFPLRGAQENSLLLQFSGQPFDSANPPGSRQRFVTPGFFDAMGVKLFAGRDFNADDKQGTTQVVIVNRTFVRRYLSG